jgi:hypothetical protein
MGMDSDQSGWMVVRKKRLLLQKHVVKLRVRHVANLQHLLSRIDLIEIIRMHGLHASLQS